MRRQWLTTEHSERADACVAPDLADVVGGDVRSLAWEAPAVCGVSAYFRGMVV